MDYKRNRHYFSTVNWKMVAIILLVSIASFFFKVIIGIILLLGIAIYIFMKFYELPTDSDIDKVYNEQSRQILVEGYEKHGISEEEASLREPIVLHGPSFEALRYNPVIKKGQDKKVRSSNYDVSVFYFGKDQLYFYQKTFSVIDQEQNEIIDSYFYEDIVSVAMKSEVTNYYNMTFRRDEFVNLDSIKIHSTGSNAIECSVKDIKESEQEINTLRKILSSEKKQIV